jgi:hypothetical protein
MLGGRLGEVSTWKLRSDSRQIAGFADSKTRAIGGDAENEQTRRARVIHDHLNCD